jgi:hypothetical protein
MNDAAKPAPPAPDKSIIDQVEKAAEAAAERGVEKAVATVYATYGPKVLRWEAVTIGGSMFGGTLAALLVFAVVKSAFARIFARKV